MGAHQQQNHAREKQKYILLNAPHAAPNKSPIHYVRGEEERSLPLKSADVAQSLHKMVLAPDLCPIRHKRLAEITQQRPGHASKRWFFAVIALGFLQRPSQLTQL